MAVAEAELDAGPELIDAGGWAEVTRSVVSASDATSEVKAAVLRRSGLEP